MYQPPSRRTKNRQIRVAITVEIAPRRSSPAVASAVMNAVYAVDALEAMTGTLAVQFCFVLVTSFTPPVRSVLREPNAIDRRRRLLRDDVVEALARGVDDPHGVILLVQQHDPSGARLIDLVQRIPRSVRTSDQQGDLRIAGRVVARLHRGIQGSVGGDGDVEVVVGHAGADG